MKYTNSSLDVLVIQSLLIKKNNNNKKKNFPFPWCNYKKSKQ